MLGRGGTVAIYHFHRFINGVSVIFNLLIAYERGEHIVSDIEAARICVSGIIFSEARES